MNKVIREVCCICSSADLEPYFDLKNFPIYMGVSEESIENDKFADQNWVACKKCGCLQLSELVPLDLLYSNNHSSGAVGEIWQNHHKEFAEFILASSPINILEIGGAHGYLADLILKKNPSMNYAMIEPSISKYITGVTYFEGYIESYLDKIANYESIVHSHLLEHLYHPSNFLRDTSIKMSENSKMFISFPNIRELISTGGTNSLNFEHSYYLLPEQIEYCFIENGLIINRKQNYQNHSYFYELHKKVNTIIEIERPNVEKYNIEFVNMWRDLKYFVNKVNEMYKSGSTIPIYVFGAHIFTQGLINLGLDQINLSGILDNAVEKQGKRLYGTKLNVFSPEHLRGLGKCAVILKTSHYQDEIKQQLKTINHLVEIIE